MRPVPKKICLDCRNFSLQTVATGVCKVVKGLPAYPVKATEDSCARWLDCGQQYYIRIGWIKARLAQEQDAQITTGTGIIT